MPPKPLLLAILDGFGLAPDSPFNAIARAATPNLDHWFATRPHARLLTSGLAVGLPEGQMGNSEVGHLNLGAGRVVYQEYTRIGRAIEEGTFFTNPALVEGVKGAVAQGGAVHILGLLSPGGVHSHTDHLLAAVRLAREQGAGTILVHAILDGRDTPPRSALEYLAAFQRGLEALGSGTIATVCGRYWAMDRDQRWERVERAYQLLTRGEGERAASAAAAVEAAYARGEDDEFVQPTVVLDGAGAPTGLIGDGDAVLVLNFRADRVREISHAFTDPEQGPGHFTGFPRRTPPRLAAWVCLTLYDESLTNVTVAFPPVRLTRILGEELARHGLTQLRAAETEKYAHVTYFFNGGQETPFPGEERLLIPSPKVATYDLQPQMSAQPLTDALVERIAQGGHDLIVVNYANPDMVGHTGKLEAAIQAIETVDACLGRLAAAVLERGGEMLITADHGNADQMLEVSTGSPHTAHTTNPAPLIHLGRRSPALGDGRLCDVAPTLLALLELPQPPEMEGRSLLGAPASHAA